MRKTVITRTCDLPHEVEHQGANTISFGLDRKDYELEACPEHEQEMRAMIKGYVRKAKIR